MVGDIIAESVGEIIPEWVGDIPRNQHSAFSACHCDRVSRRFPGPILVRPCGIPTQL
jgi:hypothetical protein